MIYIYFGDNPSFVDWLHKTINTGITVCTNYLQINNALSEALRKKKEEDCCVFVQRKNKHSDIPIITQLHKHYPSIYVVLIGNSLSIEEK